MGIHLLHLEHVVLLLFYTLLTIVNSCIYRGMKGIHWFSLYNLFALLGSIAVAFRGQIPDSISIVAGNMFVITGYIFLFLSLADLFGRKFWDISFQIGMLVIGASAMLQYGFFHPDTKTRLVAYSIVLACQQFQIAIFLYRKDKERNRSIAAPMAFVLLLLSITNMVRVVGVYILGAPSDYLRAGTFLQWILIVASCLQCALIVSYVWMTAALLRRDLEIQASTDPLTGLLNRRAMELAAERELISSKGTAVQTCAIIIDLDGFKRINDSYGHHCGDATLIAVALCLQRGIRINDYLARIGGDEFAILLPRTSLHKAMDIAEQLRCSIENLEIVHGHISTRVTGSFGLAQIEDARLDWGHLMMSCDQALYQVKKAGGNLAAQNMN